MRWRLSVPGECLVCGTANCACKGSQPDSPNVLRMLRNREAQRTMVPVRRLGGGMFDMAKTQTVDINAGQVEPGGSNARAVRDGLRTRLGSTGSKNAAANENAESTNTETSDAAQPVNRGEDIAESDVDVRTARRPARGAKAASTRAAKTTARRSTTRRR